MLSQHCWKNDFGINHLGRDVVVYESVRRLHRGGPKNLRTKSRSRGEEHKSSTHAPPFLPSSSPPPSRFLAILWDFYHFTRDLNRRKGNSEVERISAYASHLFHPIVFRSRRFTRKIICRRALMSVMCFWESATRKCRVAYAKFICCFNLNKYLQSSLEVLQMANCRTNGTSPHRQL